VRREKPRHTPRKRTAPTSPLYPRQPPWALLLEREGQGGCLLLLPFSAHVASAQVHLRHRTSAHTDSSLHAGRHSPPGSTDKPAVGTTVTEGLESVKLLPPPPDKNKPEVYGALTKEAVARAEVQSPQRERTVCMTVTTTDNRDRGRPSSWSAAIDQMTSGADDDVRRLMCVAAGNVDAAHRATPPIGASDPTSAPRDPSTRTSGAARLSTLPPGTTSRSSQPSAGGGNATTSAVGPGRLAMRSWCPSAHPRSRPTSTRRSPPRSACQSRSPRKEGRPAAEEDRQGSHLAHERGLHQG
jgi:hypothetical protein